LEHKIIVAGIGPGHPDYVLPAAMKAIRSAEVLVGGSRALSDFSSENQKTMVIRGDIPGVLAFIKNELEKQDVVVMVSGDPGYYSLLDALKKEFQEKNLFVIPGISSVQFAFARLALPWHDADLLSFHGRRPSDDMLGYAPGRILGMLTDTKYSSRTISSLLIKMGWPEDTKTAVCARLSYDDERILKTTLAGALTEKEETHCVMVVMG